MSTHQRLFFALSLENSAPCMFTFCAVVPEEFFFSLCVCVCFFFLFLFFCTRFSRVHFYFSHGPIEYIFIFHLVLSNRFLFRIFQSNIFFILHMVQSNTFLFCTRSYRVNFYLWHLSPSSGEASVLDLWVTTSLPLILCPLWLGVVVSVRFSPISQKVMFKNYWY